MNDTDVMAGGPYALKLMQEGAERLKRFFAAAGITDKAEMRSEKFRSLIRRSPSMTADQFISEAKAIAEKPCP